MVFIIRNYCQHPIELIYAYYPLIVSKLKRGPQDPKGGLKYKRGRGSLGPSHKRSPTGACFAKQLNRGGHGILGGVP